VAGNGSSNGDRRGPSIVAIGGSVRPGNYTWMALELVLDEIRRHEEIRLEAINPADLPLPLPGLPDTSGGAARLQAAVREATGVILATPEYHGTFSSVMKLVIENLGFPSLLKGKPIALLGVAAGRIGAIKALEHLRGVCSHVGAIVLPGPVSVANVQQVFDAQGHCLDPVTGQQIRSLATNLIDYIHGYICPRVSLEELVRLGVIDAAGRPVA
jgi:chromate reductase, NAD(P)H dehydrogenase (quinone)